MTYLDTVNSRFPPRLRTKEPRVYFSDENIPRHLKITGLYYACSRTRGVPDNTPVKKPKLVFEVQAVKGDVTHTGTAAEIAVIIGAAQGSVQQALAKSKSNMIFGWALTKTGAKICQVPVDMPLESTGRKVQEYKATKGPETVIGSASDIAAHIGGAITTVQHMAIRNGSAYGWTITKTGRKIPGVQNDKD